MAVPSTSAVLLPRSRAPLTGGLARGGLAALGLSLTAVAVPAIELYLARRRPRLPERDLVLDGPVGHADDPGALSVVWLGDSLAAGVGAASAEGSLPRQVAAQVSVPMSLRVLARSGSRVADVVADQLPRLAALDTTPDLVVISVGANDAAHLTRAKEFQASYRQLLTALSGLAVVVLGVPNVADSRTMAQPLRALAGLRGKMVDRQIRRVLADFDEVDYIDIASRPADAVGKVAHYLSEDRYHPNERGYGLWATRIAERLRDRLAASYALRAAALAATSLPASAS